MIVVEIAAALLILLGALFVLLAAVGVLRLPDLLSRIHAASKAGSVGATLILVAIAMISFDLAITLRSIVTILFLLLTTPVGAHLLARASIHAGDKLADATVLDDLNTQERSQS